MDDSLSAPSNNTIIVIVVVVIIIIGIIIIIVAAWNSGNNNGPNPPSPANIPPNNDFKDPPKQKPITQDDHVNPTNKPQDVPVKLGNKPQDVPTKVFDFNPDPNEANSLIDLDTSREERNIVENRPEFSRRSRSTRQSSRKASRLRKLSRDMGRFTKSVKDMERIAQTVKEIQKKNPIAVKMPQQIVDMEKTEIVSLNDPLLFQNPIVDEDIFYINAEGEEVPGVPNTNINVVEYDSHVHVSGPDSVFLQSGDNLNVIEDMARVQEPELKKPQNISLPGRFPIPPINRGIIPKSIPKVIVPQRRNPIPSNDNSDFSSTTDRSSPRESINSK